MVVYSASSWAGEKVAMMGVLRADLMVGLMAAEMDGKQADKWDDK